MLICRTPPCDQKLEKEGVGRVVVALLDPDPRVQGMGVQYLLQAGIQVSVGVCAKQVCS
jgi:diaminohydroxyphosphoribosylaminopyrimidine deaminase / 5-amino-6-(5-phosphoribosylamino)uracil reductase